MTSYIVFMAYLSQTQLGTGVAVVVVVLTFQPTKGYSRASLVAQLVKNLPAMQETPIQFLGQEDPLEKGEATHSSILAWRIPMDRRAWWATVHGRTVERRVRQD